MAWLWGIWGSGEEKRKFEVLIYEEDYKELCAHVLEKLEIETGGDLFGLWLDEHKAVIQVALGPGKACRRSSTSFYQDVNYLARVGSHLTKNEGLCHIGEWHSHHQLGLAQPSGGDESTVWNNMPTYNLSKFVIFIANIEASYPSYKVNISCFLFEIDSRGNQLPVLPGEFRILHSENPFSRKKEVKFERNNGAETSTGRSEERNSPRADDPNAPPKKKGNGYGRGKGTETSGRSPQEREENLPPDTNCENQKDGDRTVDDSRKGREKEHGIDGEKESQKIENQLPTGREESKEKGEEVKSGVISGGADQMGTSNHDNKEVAQQTKNGPEAARDPFDGKKKDVSTGDSEVQGKEKEGGRKRNEDGTPSANEIEKKKEDEESTEDGNEDTMQVQTKTEAENEQKNAEEGPSPVIQQPAPINHQDSNVRDDGPRSIGGSKGDSAVQENEKQEERGRGESGRPDPQEGEKETEEAGGKETPQDHERGENEGLKAGAKEKKTEIAENIQAEGKETHDNDQPTNRKLLLSSMVEGDRRILHSENPFSRKKEVKFERNNGTETSTGRSEETNINIKNLELKEDRTGAPAVIMLRGNFEVFIYEEDYKEMCAHVLRKPDIETGGDLFGLWLDERKAVVQLALGPGKGCKRTSVSFYQDVSYLAKVGSYLTKKEGVCHIGEWHSHHQLGLARPSGGDESTVWRNMPTYNLSRFVIFIANIEATSQNYKVNIGCFLFEMDSKGKCLPVRQGAFKILPSKNPFWQKKEVYRERSDGAENPEGDVFDVDIKDFTLVKGEKSPHVTIQRPRIKRNSPRADDPYAPPKKKGNGYGRGKGTETSGRSQMRQQPWDVHEKPSHRQEREANLAPDTNCENQKDGDRTVDDSRKGREKEHGIDGEKESQKNENQLPIGSEESKEKGEEVKSGVISGGADQMGTSNHDNKEVAQQTKNGPEAARDPFDGKKKDVSTGDSEVQGKEKEGGRKRNEDGTPSANEIEKKKEDEESTEDGNEDTMQVQTKTEAENEQKNAEEGPSPVIQQPAPINHQDSNVRDDGPRSIDGSKGDSAVQENEKQEERGRGESGRPDAQEGEKETEEAGGKETPQDHERGENEGLKAGAKEKKTEIAENIHAEGKETHDNDQPTNRSARDQGDDMKRDLKKAVKHNELAEEKTLTLSKPSTKKEQKEKPKEKNEAWRKTSKDTADKAKDKPRGTKTETGEPSRKPVERKVNLKNTSKPAADKPSPSGNKKGSTKTPQAKAPAVKTKATSSVSPKKKR
ncbi:myb-like protein X [Montipora capricornis]|uniref:myb-like protein X n=1 Tax=Montipora capricornis TaxID=246305 RepID=UPI0035F1E43C